MEKQDGFSGFPTGSVAKNPPANTGASRDMGLIPGLGRFPGGGNGKLIQHSCLVNPMDRVAWQATVHGVTESDRTEVTERTHMQTGSK